MKVLFAHNYYRSSSPSGEDAVYRSERALLESRGIEVIPYERFNDQIDESTFSRKVKLALDGAWSRETYRELSDLLRDARPDIAHFHNIFPLISPSAYAACREHRVPVVQTLHNFRFICPGALLMRQGRPCEECVGRLPLPALRHRCYRNSLPATGAQVWTILSNRWRDTYRSLVDRYIVPTRFAASRLAAGLPPDLLSVKPHFLPDPPSPGRQGSGLAVFAGRLSAEKGVRTLIAAWERLSIPLKVLGDGPLRSELEERVRKTGAPVQFLGFRPRAEVLDFMRRADLLVVPSECYEGFGLSVMEAYACGAPVVASRTGSLAEIVIEGETGVRFTPGDASDLRDKVLGLLRDRERLAAMRSKARSIFEERYTADRNFAELMRIYREVAAGVN